MRLRFLPKLCPLHTVDLKQKVNAAELHVNRSFKANGLVHFCCTCHIECKYYTYVVMVFATLQNTFYKMTQNKNST